MQLHQHEHCFNIPPTAMRIPQQLNIRWLHCLAHSFTNDQCHIILRARRETNKAHEVTTRKGERSTPLVIIEDSTDPNIIFYYYST